MHSRESTSSALDLTGTPAGIVVSRPTSPALSAADGITRRRASWSRPEGVSEGPVHFNLPTDDPEPLKRGWTVSEDPFFSPVDDDSPFAHEFPPRGFDTSTVYSTVQPGFSTVSLISNDYRGTGDMREGHREDDEARLTTNMSRPGTATGWSQSGEDGGAGLSSAGLRLRRKGSRFGKSPLKATSTRLQAVTENLRRASVRVVNFAGFGLDDHVRLADVDDDSQSTFVGKAAADEEDDTETLQEESLPDLRRELPLRGLTLGCLGPMSSVRLAMYRLLVYPWTEPVILLLIILNAVILTIQAAPDDAPQPDSSGSAPPPPIVQGYFHAWEDYALFVLFCFFTLEAFARISVSGFLLDPEVPLSSLLSLVSFKSYPSSSIPASSTDPHGSLARHGSLASTHSSAHLSSRGHPTFTQRLSNLHDNLFRPFTLPHSQPSMPPSSSSASVGKATPSRTRSDTVQSKTPMMEKVLGPMQQMHMHMRNPSEPSFLANVLRSEDSDVLRLPFSLSVNKAQEQTRRNIPYLRHSWSRIDFVAIMSFWVCFALATAGVEHGTYHIGIFRALSVLRVARLLTITAGTTTIMHSLKTARPLIASVAYFVIFAMILFSIIGIQTFNGSYKRTCQIQPILGVPNQTDTGQPCGAYIDPNNLQVAPYIMADGSNGTVKGFVCSLGQVCQENALNPDNNIESFDTIYYSALQVAIVASANGWSPIMYNMMDAEYFVSCFYFIICIVLLNFWLINLFVAVITNSFAAIRTETKKSAFGAAAAVSIVEENDEGWTVVNGRKVPSVNRIKKIYASIRWCWVALALASLILQATRTVDVSSTHEAILNTGESVLTLVFDIEIIIRVLAELPDWRNFFKHGQNVLDLILAIGSSIIQIPAIHSSSIYPWLTIFQLTRFYRVILEIPRMKPLLLAVFGNMYGLANMTLFLLLMNFVAALIGVQLLRGDVAAGSFIDWGQVYNAFLAVYQVFSSENWTNVLYGSAEPEIPLRQSPVVILFITGWLFFANFIVLQMFIAVINENFEVAEESKRSRQADHYWAAQRPQNARVPWLKRFNPYRWLRPAPKAIAVEDLPLNLILPMQRTLIDDYNSSRKEYGFTDDPNGKTPSARQNKKGYLRRLQRLFAGETDSQDVPLGPIRGSRRDSAMPQDPVDEETVRHLEVLAALNSETAAAEDLTDLQFERRAQKADFIRDHPTYDMTFWLFSQKNPVRRFCQKLVAPAGGERIFGTHHNPVANTLFQLVLALTVIAGIVVEIVATPIYRRNYYAQHGYTRGHWFDVADAVFGLVLLLEFFVKVVADGFSFTPNAYVRSIWNVLDFFILCGVLVNVITGLVFIGGLSRFTRSLKALRVLRFITLIDKMRSTFESLIISGAARILDAALLAILYMIPYAVWGLNIFAGSMAECNDTSSNVTGITTCINEYSNTIYGSDFGFPVPRVWDYPSPSTTFSFDNFGSSLLILFEIVSLEGWVDVMTVATSLTGIGSQPQIGAAQWNSIFFLIYNLLGGVVILTLFVSIIIGNFTSRTGSALLTQQQREWIDLQKLIKRQRPSKRPKKRPTWIVRAWCYDRAVHKHGWWHRMMTGVFLLHVLALMTQTLSTSTPLDDFRNYFMIFVTMLYTVDTIIRFYGLGWRSFRANGWNLFDALVAGGSLLTTILIDIEPTNFALTQLNKVFITLIALKLVQRMNNLNKLFKTAISSLPVIISLLGLWLILFLFFAIMFVEVFSLTKWNSAENWNENYTSMSHALVMLAFMTTGEGWNQYMHDFALEYPRCTILSSGDTDCGSEAWAFSLFIAWNLLSMYIFANLFTGVVVESFYYVFQMSGGAKAVTREEMRAFKKVWAEFANPQTGYLERAKFVRFFGRLTGIFEVKIYPTEFSIPEIMMKSKEGSDSSPSMIWGGVDFQKVDAIAGAIDKNATKRRKNVYNRLFHEARISCEPGKGISFTNMLLLLAHHKLIVDREALILKDLVIRNETNKLVTDLVDFDRVQSLLLMISHRRRYLAAREQHRQKHMSDHDIPAIIVDSRETTPPLSTRDITSPMHDSATRRFSDVEPALMPIGASSPDFSFTLDTPSRPGLQRSRRTSEISMLSIDSHRYSADISSRESRAEEDPDHILSAMQNSMWQEMMDAAGEED